MTKQISQARTYRPRGHARQHGGKRCCGVPIVAETKRAPGQSTWEPAAVAVCARVSDTSLARRGQCDRRRGSVDLHASACTCSGTGRCSSNGPPPRPPRHQGPALHAPCQRRARASPQNATPRRRAATSHRARRGCRRPATPSGEDPRAREPLHRRDEPTKGARPAPGGSAFAGTSHPALFPASCQRARPGRRDKSLKFHAIRAEWPTSLLIPGGGNAAGAQAVDTPLAGRFAPAPARFPHVRSPH